MAINDRGQIAGDGNGYDCAFAWQQGKMTRLPAPRGRDCTTGDHSTALAINEGGVVIGATYTDDCYNRCPRAAIWTYKP